MQPKQRVILVVVDGLGYAKPGPGNYVAQAKTPVLDQLLQEYPHTLNLASGNAVGLPEDAQGNSEVGHLHLGAGRVVWQLYERLNQAIADGSFFHNCKLREAIKQAKSHNSTLHLIGLCSDAGVHTHTDHLLALLKMAQQQRVEKVFVHFIADGRDVPERSALKYIREIEAAGGKIATIIGRYYALDRDKNWSRTSKAYHLLVQANGIKAASAALALKIGYKTGVKTDYYLPPLVICDRDDQPLTTIQDHDSVIFFNFRTDRPRQLSHALADQRFTYFKRQIIPKIKFTPLTSYDDSFIKTAAYLEQPVPHNLASVLAAHKLRQFRLAETEKYAHVTYFFNSQREQPYPYEDRLMVPSRKVASYDRRPEMSAAQITQQALRKISMNKYDFILINYANCDLVGHSAVKSAVIKAVETVDNALGQVVGIARQHGYVVILTADHGNAEDKLYPDGTPKPSHSRNPVYFILITDDPKLKAAKLQPGGQQDVAPTILALMGLKKPREMTGHSKTSPK